MTRINEEDEEDFLEQNDQSEQLFSVMRSQNDDLDNEIDSWIEKSNMFLKEEEMKEEKEHLILSENYV